MYYLSSTGERGIGQTRSLPSFTTFAPWKKSYDNLDRVLKSQFANKNPHNQSYGFSNSHVQVGELDHKEG